MKIVFEKDTLKLQKFAGEKLAELIGSAGKPTLLLVAGGSSFALLDFVEEKVLTKNLTVGMSDERFDQNLLINNFTQLKKTNFYKRALERDVTFFDSSVQVAELFEQYGMRFEKNISDWFEKNKNGKVIATFGIGGDGHTCGIMPFPENPELFKNLFESEKLSADYNATGKNEFPLRVTITNTFLREHVFAGVVYTTGEGKRKVFENVKNEKGSLAETPARILLEIPNITFFTDLESN